MFSWLSKTANLEIPSVFKTCSVPDSAFKTSPNNYNAIILIFITFSSSNLSTIATIASDNKKWSFPYKNSTKLSIAWYEFSLIFSTSSLINNIKSWT